MEKVLTGAAGEYYVAFRLAAMGYAVGLTTRGVSTIDLIAANVKTSKSITIQTKTMLNAFTGCWWSTIRSVGNCSGIMSVDGRTDIDYKGTEQITDSKRGTRKALDYAGGSQSHGGE